MRYIVSSAMYSSSLMMYNGATGPKAMGPSDHGLKP
jgi:hypothetical protein